MTTVQPVNNTGPNKQGEMGVFLWEADHDSIELQWCQCCDEALPPTYDWVTCINKDDDGDDDGGGGVVYCDHCWENWYMGNEAWVWK